MLMRFISSVNPRSVMKAVSNLSLIFGFFLFPGLLLVAQQEFVFEPFSLETGFSVETAETDLTQLTPPPEDSDKLKGWYQSLQLELNLTSIFADEGRADAVLQWFERHLNRYSDSLAKWQESDHNPSIDELDLHFSGMKEFHRAAQMVSSALGNQMIFGETPESETLINDLISRDYFDVLSFKSESNRIELLEVDPESGQLTGAIISEKLAMLKPFKIQVQFENGYSERWLTLDVETEQGDKQRIDLKPVGGDRKKWRSESTFFAQAKEKGRRISFEALAAFRDKEWAITYEDNELGQVKGRVHVREDNDVMQYRVTHPESETDYYLELYAIRPSTGGYELTFKGENPVASTVTGGRRSSLLPTGIPLSVGSDAERLKFSFDGSERTYQLINVANQIVKVSLARSGENDWQGRWTYIADPETQRDQTGGNRVGHYHSVDSRQSGAESWRLLEPRIYHAQKTIEQQSKRNQIEAIYRYPFSESNPTSSTLKRRIAVFGVDLPERTTDRHVFEEGDFHIEYDIESVEKDRDDQPEIWNEVDRIRQEILNEPGIDPETKRVIKEEDVVILRADLREGVLPRLTVFKMNESAGCYPLIFGDLAAKFTFMRKMDQDEWIAAPELYMGDDVWIQLELSKEVPLDEVKVLATQGPIWSPQNTALRLQGQSDRTILLHRQSENPRIYRSKKIHLTSESRLRQPQPIRTDAELTMVYKYPGQGEAPNHVFLGLEPEFQKHYLLVPAEPADLPFRVRNPVNPYWIKALHKAARCKGEDFVQRVRDWEQLAFETQETITNVDVNLGFYGILRSFDWAASDEELDFLSFSRQTRIQFGHHAALLIMRDHYVRRLVKMAGELDTIVKDEASTAAFLERHRDAIHLETHPLHFLEAEGPDEKKYEWGTILLPFERRFPMFEHFNERDYIRWQRFQSMRVLAIYRNSLLEYANALADLDDCDMGDVLADLRFAMPLLAQEVKPLLVKPDHRNPDRDGHERRWKPDKVAQTWMDNLVGMADTLKSRQAEADTDTFALKIQIALANGLLGMGSEAMMAQNAYRTAMGMAAASATVDTTMFGFEIYSQIRGYLNFQRDLRASHGAAFLIGPGYHEAIEKQYQDFLTFVGPNLLISLAQVTCSVHGAVQVYRALPETPVPVYRPDGTSGDLVAHGSVPHDLPTTSRRPLTADEMDPTGTSFRRMGPDEHLPNDPNRTISIDDYTPAMENLDNVVVDSPNRSGRPVEPSPQLMEQPPANPLDPDQTVGVDPYTPDPRGLDETPVNYNPGTDGGDTVSTQGGLFDDTLEVNPQTNDPSLMSTQVDPNAPLSTDAPVPTNSNTSSIPDGVALDTLANPAGERALYLTPFQVSYITRPGRRLQGIDILHKLDIMRLEFPPGSQMRQGIPQEP